MYSTPSERWTSAVRRFASLRPLDGLRLARAIWTMSIVVYAVQFALVSISAWSYIALYRQSSTAMNIVALTAPLSMQLIEPLLILLMIRLALEVCMRMLQASAAGPEEAPERPDGRAR